MISVSKIVPRFASILLFTTTSSSPLVALIPQSCRPSRPVAFFATATTTSSTTAITSRMSSGNEEQEYVPPKVWKYENSDGSKFTMNRPTAGARTDKELPVGEHPIQLYSLATPNGQKVTIMLEELLAIGKQNDAEYDAYLINIMEGDQFGSDFVGINPNSKIPAMTIYENGKDRPPLKLFESGSILLHLAEKFDNAFLPTDPEKRVEALNWLFWQMGSAPYLGGGFGHFYQYADVKMRYPIDRFTMEVKRQLDVLNRNLATRNYMVGDEYTIADIAIFPWYGGLVLGKLYGDAATFLNVEQDYPHVLRWANEIKARPAVKRGLIVNSSKLHERHSASDIDNALLKASAEEEEASKL